MLILSISFEVNLATTLCNQQYIEISNIREYYQRLYNARIWHQLINLISEVLYISQHYTFLLTYVLSILGLLVELYHSHV